MGTSQDVGPGRPTTPATTTGRLADRVDRSGGVAGLLHSPVRRAVVEELAALRPTERNVGLTALELGRKLSLHSTTIRFHVDQLVAAGMLDFYFARSGGVGRPSKCYVLRERSLGESATGPSGPEPFTMLAGVLASALSADEADPLTPEEAGIRWVARRAQQAPPRLHDQSAQGKVGQVVELLSEWGYTPDTTVGDDGVVDMTLRGCPFLDLAHTHPDVVCGMHRGLLHGALEAVGEAGARVSLQPFVGPDTCRAQILLRGVDAATDPPSAGPAHTETASPTEPTKERP